MKKISLLVIALFLFCSIGWTAEEDADEILAQRIRDALILAPEVFDAFLEVTVEEGIVFLSGRVLTEAERDFALQVIYKIPGVYNVQMDVEVRPLEAKDAVLLKELPSAQSEPFVPMLRRQSLQPLPPKIERPQKSKADKTREYNEKQAIDDQLQKSVQFVVKMNLDLSRVQGIYVTVTDREVTLSGVVADPMVRRQAEEAARRVNGVKKVNNQILVR